MLDGSGAKFGIKSSESGVRHWALQHWPEWRCVLTKKTWIIPAKSRVGTVI
jgi:hypothetical protein